MNNLSLFNIKLCNVESVDDKYGGGRIKVRVFPEDNGLSLDEINYAYPLLPKMFNALPKVGESVIVLFSQTGDGKSLRFFIGPIISQLNHLQYESNNNSKRLFQSYSVPMSPNPERFEDCIGAWGGKDDVSIYGRKGTDIILKENDIRIRCGSRIDSNNLIGKCFNGDSSAYLKLKYSDIQTKARSDYNGEEFTYNSTATLVADQINLIGNNSDLHFNTGDNKDLVTDETIKKIIEKAHVLPYGDVLIEFLKEFLNMFKNHSHQWIGHPTILPSGSEGFWDYLTGNKLDKMLSKSVRIN